MIGQEKVNAAAVTINKSGSNTYHSAAMASNNRKGEYVDGLLLSQTGRAMDQEHRHSLFRIERAPYARRPLERSSVCPLRKMVGTRRRAPIKPPIGEMAVNPCIHATRYPTSFKNLNRTVLEHPSSYPPNNPRLS